MNRILPFALLCRTHHGGWTTAKLTATMIGECASIAVAGANIEPNVLQPSRAS